MPSMSQPYKTFLIDMDGVVWRGNTLQRGAMEFITWLNTHGYSYRYLSNNSMVAPAELGVRLRDFGIPAQDKQVITASSATVNLLATRYPGQPVWVTGLPSLRQMVANAGLRVINLQRGDAPDDPALPATSAKVVMVGLDRSLTYAGLQQAARALLAGADFLAVNRDFQLPVDDGFDPGCGAIVAALEYTTKRTAEAVGKPSPLLVHEALAEMHMPAESAVIIGDALEQDISAGQSAGIATILVLSGVTSAEKAARAVPPPTMIARDLADVLEQLDSWHQ
jgi:HAD superfamily hydrolase (TIGR01450 family)